MKNDFKPLFVHEYLVILVKWSHVMAQFCVKNIQYSNTVILQKVKMLQYAAALDLNGLACIKN